MTKTHQFSNKQLSAPSFPKILCCRPSMHCGVEFVGTVCLLCVHTGTGTVKASPGGALKNHRCLCAFLSIYYNVKFTIPFAAFALLLFSCSNLKLGYDLVIHHNDLVCLCHTCYCGPQNPHSEGALRGEKQTRFCDGLLAFQ